MENKITMEDRMKNLEDKFDTFTSKMNDIYVAIVGNPKFQTMGMLDRISKLEKTVSDLDLQRKKLVWLTTLITGFTATVVPILVSVLLKYL